MKFFITFGLVLMVAGSLAFRPRAPENSKVRWTTRTSTSFDVVWAKSGSNIRHQIVVMDTETDRVVAVHNVSAEINEYKVEGGPVKPWGEYDVAIYAINEADEFSLPSKRVYVKVLWSIDLEIVKRYTNPIIEPKAIPVGKCGEGWFTCKDDGDRCVPPKYFCDRRRHCYDFSDERECPDNCVEIQDNEFVNGNFSCTIFGSPFSTCSYSCNKGYKLDGKSFTKCSPYIKQWTTKVPICRILAVDLGKVSIKNNTVEVRWKEVQYAVKYSVTLIPQTLIEEDIYEDGKAVTKQLLVADVTSQNEDDKKKKKGKVDELYMVFNDMRVHDAYRIVMSAFDMSGTEGHIIDEILTYNYFNEH